MRGFEAIPELVQRAKVPVVFSMLGSTNVPWIGQGVESGAFRLVKTRHEETAVAAATGFSRATGLTGVCGVTRGPGFANSINPLIAATRSHVPLVLLVGESSSTRLTQNIDQRGMTEVIGAGFRHIERGDALEGAFWEALHDAHYNGCPQVLSIADTLLETRVELSDHAPTMPLGPHEPPNAESIAAAVDALAEAERPLILAGQGAVLADCREEIEELAHLTGARLATSLNANRFFSGHPRDLGLCGSWSPPLAREHIAESDVVFALGASLNRHTMAEGHAFGGAKVIHCEIDTGQPCLASSPELALLGDARSAVSSVLREWRRRGLGHRSAQGPMPTAEEIRASVRHSDLGHDPDRGLDLRQVYTTLNQKLPEDRIVVSDAGRHLGVLPSLVDARDARSWVVSRGYGSVGLGLGAAIGAAAAHPDRPVVLFCGDGGFMMAAQELDTVRVNELSLTVVIMNDEQYGAEVRYLSQYGLPGDVVKQPLPDIPALAEVFGGSGVVIRTDEELRQLRIPEDGLFLVDARIDPAVDGGGSSFLGAFT